MTSSGSKTFTGNCGLVIIPDERTVATAIKFGEIPSVATYRVRRPHLTLHIASVCNLTNDAIHCALDSLIETLQVESTVGLTRQLSVFGESYLFWDAVRNKALEQAHRNALSLLTPVLAPASNQAAANQTGLQFTEDELKNIHTYGYPFVGELYRPHITLSFGQNMSASSSIPFPIDELSTMRIAQIAFVSVGDFGSIDSVLHSRDLK